MAHKMGSRRVDRSALRTNQAFIIALLLLAFIVDSVPLVLVVCLVMVTGTLFPVLSVFKQIYAQVLKPAGLVKPEILADNPEPHRFAQGFGGVVLAAALVWFYTGGSMTGWLMVWLVVILAGLNLFVGFCAGCFMYYQLNRLKFPGFSRAPLREGNSEVKDG